MKWFGQRRSASATRSGDFKEPQLIKIGPLTSGSDVVDEDSPSTNTWKRDKNKDKDNSRPTEGSTSAKSNSKQDPEGKKLHSLYQSGTLFNVSEKNREFIYKYSN